MKAIPVATGDVASSAQISNGAQPGQPTAPTPETANKLIALPAPFPPGLIQGIDVKAQSHAIVVHLGETVRYYRMAVVPIQKIGEPSDMLYAEQAQGEATEIGQLAFRAARSQAEFITRIPGSNSGGYPPETDEANKAAATLRQLSQHSKDLQAEEVHLNEQIAHATSKQLPSLQEQKGDVEGQLKLSNAVLLALQKVVSSSSTQAGGLTGNIDQLQHSVPELIGTDSKAVPATIESVASVREEGVTTQATILFQLLGTERAIDDRLRQLKLLHEQANTLREPLVKVLEATFVASQTLQSDTGSTAADIRDKRKKYDDLTDAFTTLSDVAVPLSQEILILEQAQGTLGSWRASVAATRLTIIHSLLLRVGAITATVLVLLGLGAIWRRAVLRYVEDVRRRRQLLLIRRLVIGFLSGLVLILGFVSQFNSLATFAGFITAGIAVGLQTILLSIAAYFFIVGRYGVKVGDRITVVGVTGEVVEVGLVRFYLLELVGTGTELHPTGRIAVFANSVLFQAGTPLYKQIPGTGYVWHEITVRFKLDSNYRPALDVVKKIVDSVYEGYKASLEKDHREVESWLDAAIQGPRVEARLQLVEGLQYAILYPVRISEAAETDEKIVQQILAELNGPSRLGEVIDGVPEVRAVVKS